MPPSKRVAVFASLLGILLSTGAGQAQVGSQTPFAFDAPLKSAGAVFPQASGLVKFRQPEDRVQTVELDVSVTGLAPNTHYELQRAVDQTLDGRCAGADWLTLGADNKTPREIVTDARGAGRAFLTRNLSAFPRGTAFDIHFRVVEKGGSVVALESACHAFTIR